MLCFTTPYKPLLCIEFVNFDCIYWGHSIYVTVMVLEGLERHVTL